MTEDSVESFFPRWMVFGEHADGAHVDIADPAGDVFEKVPRAVADELIAARNAYVNSLIHILKETPYSAVRRGEDRG